MALTKNQIEDAKNQSFKYGNDCFERKVYILCDNDYVFYVGVTASPILNRFLNHLRESKNKPLIKKSARIAKILSEGRMPEIHVLESYPVCHRNYLAFKMEKYWIWQFRSWGFELDNEVT